MSTSRVVCQCHNVSEATICAQLTLMRGQQIVMAGHPHEQLNMLKNTLKCGTECGSCLPALRALIAASVTNSAKEAA
ncbi:MAG: hypothetical protein HC778_03430 [Chamaesiphon sp. CSU_1_12]|nr:hypothetical protein [Chamaesiphon sp. CSU_1_12]